MFRQVPLFIVSALLLSAPARASSSRLIENIDRVLASPRACQAFLVKEKRASKSRGGQILENERNDLLVTEKTAREYITRNYHCDGPRLTGQVQGHLPSLPDPPPPPPPPLPPR